MKQLIEAADSYFAANNDGHVNYAVVIQRIEGTTEVTVYSNFEESGELVVAHGSATQLTQHDNQWLERAIYNCTKVLEAHHAGKSIRQ